MGSFGLLCPFRLCCFYCVSRFCGSGVSEWCVDLVERISVHIQKYVCLCLYILTYVHQTVHTLFCLLIHSSIHSFMHSFLVHSFVSFGFVPIHFIPFFPLHVISFRSIVLCSISFNLNPFVWSCTCMHASCIYVSFLLRLLLNCVYVCLCILCFICLIIVFPTYVCFCLSLLPAGRAL